MFITIEHHKDQFNVNLSSKEGADAFLSIKGCKIVEGRSGPFISYPASKYNSNGVDKWWNHVWASEKFNDEVLKKVQASTPKQSKAGGGSRQTRNDDFDADSVPF